MTPGPAPGAALLLALASLLAGCAASPQQAPPGGDQPLEASGGGETSAQAGANTTAEAGAGAEATAGQGAYPPQEHTLSVTYYASAGPADTGNMGQAVWELAVPQGARLVRATAEWSPSTPASAEQSLMIHLGTAAEMGDMIAGVAGGSPLATEWVPIPEGSATLALMCHVMGRPVNLEVMQETRLVAEFA